jgi:tetrahydromethanopterin S-methyltransferase subunit F
MHNPYAPPTHDAWVDPQSFEPPGNYWAGFAIGFLFALIGLVIVYLVAKPETKRGSLHGFGTRIGLTVAVVMLALLLG